MSKPSYTSSHIGEKSSTTDSGNMASPNHSRSYDKSVVTHSFLLSNLHCPSCVSYIRESLSTLNPMSVSPSLVSSWVTVEHKGALTAGEIQRALEDAGFNVCDVTPNDGSGRKALPLKVDWEIGYLDRFIDKIDSGKKGANSKKSTRSEKHLRNCASCRQTALQKPDVNNEFSSKTSRLPLVTPGSVSAAMQNESDRRLDLQVVVESDKDQEIWRATLAVGGMTCAACVNTITDQLQKKNWIKKVAVNLISHSATVDFVEKQHQREIVEAIDDIGYDATIDTVINLNTVQNAYSPGESAVRVVEILVEGIFCDRCPTRILSSLETFEDRVKVEKPLSVVDPILRIKYVPKVPSFTIRDIVKAISESATDDDEPFKVSVYCPPTLEERSRRIHERERQRIFIRVVVTFVIAIPTLIIGIIYMTLVSASDPGRKFLMAPLSSGVSRAQWALLVMATPVYFFCADVYHIRAFKEVRVMWRRGSTTPMLQRFYRFGSMNMLMSLGTSIAYVSSIAQLIAAGIHPRITPDNNSFYFDSVVFLTLFLLLGRLIEAYSKSKTGDAVKMLGKLRPSEALLVEDESLKLISVDLIEYSDSVRIPHGASPPCDGIILEGDTKFDESSLTGESKLIKKTIGDPVFSGTVNRDSPISIKITGVAGSSMLDQIVKAVQEGQTKRAPMERIADTLTSYFVPFVTLIATITWIVWLSLGYSGALPREYLGEDSGGWAAWSLQFAIALFVVACPCGLALAAPTALFVGGGLAAQHGILVKGGGEAFEKASRLDCIVFDKTGTLTVGDEPAVTDALSIALSTKLGNLTTATSDEVILAMVWVIEGNSSHTLAQALRSYCKEKGTHDVQLECTALEEIPGKGMKGSFRVSGSQNVDIMVGNEALIAESNVYTNRDSISNLERWKSKGHSVVLVAVSIDGPSEGNDTPPSKRSWELTAMFAVSDPIRPEAPQIIEHLKKRGLQVWMLSGDNQITANAIGAQVGIPADNIIAGVLPSEKADRIQYLQKSLKSRHGLSSGAEHTEKRALVAMVGDGINDSPALTTADVGIAIGSGSDIAISSAEFVLVSSNLNTLTTLLDLSVVVFRRIKFNFAWALVYNLIALPVAAGVLYPIVSNGSHIRLDPVWASLAMAASSISVVCSSLALRSKVPFVGFKPRESYESN